MNETDVPPQAWNRPNGDLIENRDNFISIRVPLYNASVRGDWKAAKTILDLLPKLVQFGISENYDTALHIAASAKSNKLMEKFVENLVNLMTKEDLQLKNKDGNTAFCLAAAGGNVSIAEIMVKKNKSLLEIPGRMEMMPLYIASMFARYDMVKYLYENSKKMTGDFWTHVNRGWVLQKCVEADFFDIAWEIVTDRKELAEDGIVLGLLARKTDACKRIKPNCVWRVIRQIFAIIHVNMGPDDKPSDAMKLLRFIWGNILRLSKEEIDIIIRGEPAVQKDLVRGVPEVEVEKYPSRVLFLAAQMGNTEFLVELIRQYPDLIWNLDDDDRSIFHVAISHRHEGIYNLLYDLGSMKDMIAYIKNDKGNNLLHLVGKMPTQRRLDHISGVAFQMQHELLWFEEVKAMIPPSDRETKNKVGLTPAELFTKDHKELMSASETWMKDTASQSMVVATLIATIVFAAAFTIPGGYDQDSGVPTFLRKRLFIVYVISDAISLTFSSSSILIFLSILTSRYAEQDFLESLPKRLMRGLTTLFISIAAMMVSFSVSFFVLYSKDLIWVPIVIGVFASIPVILFARLQYGLLADVYHSTYGSKNLFKPGKFQLCLENPKY